LRKGRVRVDRLVSHRFRLNEIQKAYDTARQGGRALKVLVTFPREEAS
jgi:Zn-dependent alcohol dehydrogenase